MNHTLEPTSSNVISLESFRAKKMTDSDLSRGRRPLYVSHLNGTATSNKTPSPDLGDRITRIKSSLERINNLMRDLKTMSDKK